jgi:hypothetical protein
MLRQTPYPGRVQGSCHTGTNRGGADVGGGRSLRTTRRLARRHRQAAFATRRPNKGASLDKQVWIRKPSSLRADVGALGSACRPSNNSAKPNCFAGFRWAPGLFSLISAAHGTLPGRFSDLSYAWQKYHGPTFQQSYSVSRTMERGI